MNLNELERVVRTLLPKQVERFGQWFDSYRQGIRANGNGDAEAAVAEAQKEDILRRREEYLAHRSIAKPVAPAFFKRLRRDLAHARARPAAAA